jgi:stage II sporulation protein D
MTTVRRFALCAVLVVSGAACVSRPIAPSTPSPSPALPRHVRVQVIEQGVSVVRDVPLEEYVQATVISEVAPAAGDIGTVGRMLEVQAVISRTYAVSHLGRHAREGFDLCATTHCQLFEPRRIHTSRWAGASSDAVARTSGVILIFDRQPAQALFHADCGGYTSTSAAVWGGVDRPYLVARPDDVVPRESHAAWRFETSVRDLYAALSGGPSDSRTQAPGELEAIEIVSRDEAGRAERLTIRSRTGRAAGGSSISRVLRGDEFRQLLSRAFGPRALRSTRFEIRRSTATFTFEGRGFGHGVGLCQAGAFARLKAGASPAEVVRHYYPGVTMAQGSRLRAQGSGLREEHSDHSRAARGLEP